MKKGILLALGVGLSVLLCGCSELNPSIETLPNFDEATSPSNEVVTPTPEPSESENPETTEPSGEADTTEEVSENTTEDASPSMDEDGNIILNIEQTSSQDLTSSSGRMEAASGTYTNGNVTIHYPIIIGMRDTEIQAWANNLLYLDAVSLMDVYGVDPKADTMDVNFEVSVIYRGEISLVYSGTYQKADSNNVINVRAAEDLDLTNQEYIRLSDRLSATKLTEAVLESGDYQIMSANIAEDTLREYLSTLTEDFYASLIDTADFGSEDESVPYGFSYNYLGNVVVIIPIPHMFGDYAEISIVQQTK